MITQKPHKIDIHYFSQPHLKRMSVAFPKTYFSASDQVNVTSLSSNIQKAYGPVNSLKLMVVDALAQEPLGRGMKACVYPIPKLPKYALRVLNDCPVGTVLDSEPHLFPLPDRLPDLNIGQAIARIGDQGLYLLRHQPGQALGVPYAKILENHNKDEVLDTNPKPVNIEDVAPYKKLYADNLRLVAQMPQSAYDDLALKIIRIKSAGLFMDPFSNNYLVDVQTKSFNTVDHESYIGPFENLIGMLNALIDAVYVDLDERAVDADGNRQEKTSANDPILIGLRQTIFRKTIVAAYHTGLEFPSDLHPVDAWGGILRSFCLDYAFEICGATQKEAEIRDLLREHNLSDREINKQLDSILAHP